MSLPPASSNGNPVNPGDEAFRNRYIPKSIPSEEFKDYMKLRTPLIQPDVGDTIGKITPYQPNKSELLTLDQKGKDDTYLSFGDDGTTASVTERGQLMQFSRYLGPGRSSVFVADSEYVEEPYSVAYRGRHLQDMARYGWGFGKNITVLDDNWTHQISFLRDRWPRVVISGNDWKFVTQWMVKGGVVIQQSVIENLTNEPLEFELEFDSGVLIRDLDFVDPKYRFNDKTDNYIEGEGPNGYGFVKVHRLPKADGPGDEHEHEHGQPKTWYAEKKELESEKEEEQHDVVKKLAVVSVEEKSSQQEQEEPLQPEAVGLVIGFFVNGEPQKWEVLQKENWEVSPGECLKLVAGYKLVLLTSKRSEWKPLVLSAEDVDIDRFLSEGSSSYVIDVDLGYANRRNLENILSVCAIPVPPGHVWEYDNMKPKMAEPAVALTCGDMSGHRVCTSASFFAFRFLTAIARHLRQHKGYNDGDPKNPFKQLRDRIKRTCEGHLTWVFKTAKIQGRSFARDYWVNGNIMLKSSSLISNDLTNTPYQVLKAFDYYQEFSDQKLVGNLLGGGNRGSAMDWIGKLDKENTQDSYAWRHPQTIEFEKYRLDDHVWIWSALKAISTILDWKKQSKQPKRKGKLPKNDKKRSEEAIPDDLRRKYEPSKVRREMTRRFTTDNDSLKQKMLAVTRSARENRFDFHSRDTALFYDLPGEEPKPREQPKPGNMLAGNIAVWKNTLICQKHLEENQDPEWDNPLRYALSMLMARSDPSINKKMREDVFEKARQALEESMLPNGIFPGQIDEFTQEEKLFEDEKYRDFYFHVSFEMPYVLWTYKTLEVSPTIEEPPRLAPTQPQAFRRLSLTPGDLSSFHATDRGNDGNESAPVQLIEIPLSNGRIPFNKFVDSHNIVEVLDEWLYSRPLFLEFEPPESMRTFGALMEMLQGDLGEVIRKAIGAYIERTDRKFDSSPFYPKDEGEDNALIVDVPKNRGKDGPAIPKPNHLTKYFWERLQKPRTIEDAKKRFIWLPFAKEDYALMCYLTAHEEERVPLSLFFERHANYEWYFFDEAVPVQNKWETEFHTKFLRLSQSAAQPEAFENRLLEPPCEILPELDEQHLVRASAGYRFLGDFFDYYWTCHFIENYPCETEIKITLAQPVGKEGREHDFWQQRRVLELMLFNRIINEMIESMKNIVDRIQRNLKLTDNSGRLSFTHLRTDQYFSKSSEWENYIQIMDALEADFTATMDNITAWENREHERQQQPRWTTTKERKYGSAITNLLVKIRRGLRELRRYHAKVKWLRTSLVATQERIRNELTLRGSENIRYFTYATVLFLPLGFASSLFAMSAAPTHDVVITMIICSIIAVAITIFLLIIAQSAWKVIATYADKVTEYRAWKVATGASKRRAWRSRRSSYSNV